MALPLASSTEIESSFAHDNNRERLAARTEDTAALEARAVLLLDEAHLLPDWAGRIKGVRDRFRKLKTPVHIVATGSSALRLAAGSRESLAGRFERLTLTQWSACSVATVFDLQDEDAADLVVRSGFIARPDRLPAEDPRPVAGRARPRDYRPLPRPSRGGLPGGAAAE